MSNSISTPLFNEEVLKEENILPSTSNVGWNPFNNTRRRSLLPHPSDLQLSTATSDSFSRFVGQDYAFPPRNNNSALSSPQVATIAAPPWSTSSGYNDIASVPMLPEVSEEPFYREQRSLSYSFGHDNNNHHHHKLLFSPTPFMGTIMQEEDEEEEEDEDSIEQLIRSAARTRSKSSAAIMDIWNPSSSVQKDVEDAKWMAAHHRNNRRSSLIPPSSSSLMSSTNTTRRFSLAPSMSLLESNTNNNSLLNQRRHSLAGPTINNNNNNPSTMMMNSILELESLAIRERPNPVTTISTTTTISEQQQETIIKMDDMGKGTRLDSEVLNNATFYVVEFKGGRSDVFYSQPTSYYKKNELVIVEADRGCDLGKVAMEDISRQQLEIYYTQLKNVNHNTGEVTEEKTLYQPNEIYVKCIFRNARQDEITLFMAKGQDESKALVVCQSKIKQKKLNMQVVDAEYQWDRRKLTFYFIAEKRVDFRELVRELFKLYKTRIWMCAVNSIKVLE